VTPAGAGTSEQEDVPGQLTIGHAGSSQKTAIKPEVPVDGQKNALCF
jgi:hypothetical protein